MATLEIGENEVDHSNIVILLGYTDCSPSIRHCSSSELHIPLCRSTLSYYVLDDPFYHPVLIAICLSITSSFSFKRTFHRSKQFWLTVGRYSMLFYSYWSSIKIPSHAFTLCFRDKTSGSKQTLESTRRGSNI